MFKFNILIFFPAPETVNPCQARSLISSRSHKGLISRSAKCKGPEGRTVFVPQKVAAKNIAIWFKSYSDEKGWIKNV